MTKILVMGLLDRLFGSKTEDNSQERPPKPERKSGEKVYEKTRYEATVEYLNGDVETIECYGHSKTDDYIELFTDPYADCYGGFQAYQYDATEISYHTLSREPVFQETATDKFVISYTIEYEWGYGVFAPTLHKKWSPRVSGELTVRRDVD